MRSVQSSARSIGRVLSIGGLAVLVSCALAGVAHGASPHSTELRRCGFTRAHYGRSGVYPYKLSCTAARTIIARDARSVGSGIYLGFDTEAVILDGRRWVCGGRMGYYFCGYPYRPTRSHGQKTYRGPFTTYAQWITCRLIGPHRCPKTSAFTQPPTRATFAAALSRRFP